MGAGAVHCSVLTVALSHRSPTADSRPSSGGTVVGVNGRFRVRSGRWGHWTSLSESDRSRLNSPLLFISQMLHRNRRPQSSLEWQRGLPQSCTHLATAVRRPCTLSHSPRHTPALQPAAAAVEVNKRLCACSTKQRDTEPGGGDLAPASATAWQGDRARRVRGITSAWGGRG